MLIEHTKRKWRKYELHQRQVCESAFGVHDRATIGKEPMIRQLLPLDLAIRIDQDLQ